MGLTEVLKWMHGIEGWNTIKLIKWFSKYLWYPLSLGFLCWELLLCIPANCCVLSAPLCGRAHWKKSTLGTPEHTLGVLNELWLWNNAGQTLQQDHLALMRWGWWRANWNWVLWINSVSCPLASFVCSHSTPNPTLLRPSTLRTFEN